MSMLIKGGMIHTMTARGSFVGDILIREDRIEAVAPEISLPEKNGACILNASGLTILPGLIDVHIHEGPETDESLLHSQHAAGVTCGLLWPEQEGRCFLFTSSGTEDTAVYAVLPDIYSDDQLCGCFQTHAAEGHRIACEIHSCQVCRRVLHAARRTQVNAILVHLTGCDALLEEIAESGCPVVLGVNHQRCGNPWELAHKLTQLGVQVALTCNYPTAKLCHLPVCGALCAREGQDRQHVLSMLTSTPAAISGLSGRGVIEMDVPADIVIYDGDPLLLSTSHVMTIAGGKIRH